MALRLELSIRFSFRNFSLIEFMSCEFYGSAERNYVFTKRVATCEIKRRKLNFPERKAINMKQATPATRRLARYLLELEIKAFVEHQGEAKVALRVFDKLQNYLSKLIGVAGFQALLARALTLAKLEEAELEAVQIQANSRLLGFSETASNFSSQIVSNGNVALLAQFIGLLSVFIGESLTLRLVKDVWPEAQLDETNFSAEEIRLE